MTDRTQTLWGEGVKTTENKTHFPLWIQSIPFALLLGSLYKCDSPLSTEHWTKKSSVSPRCLSIWKETWQWRVRWMGGWGRGEGRRGSGDTGSRSWQKTCLIPLICFAVNNKVKTSVPDPDSNPLDRFVFRPPGYASGSDGSGSGSFPFLIKVLSGLK